MFGKHLVNRMNSLLELSNEMESYNKESKLDAVEKDKEKKEVQIRFLAFCVMFEEYLKEYRSALESFLDQNGHDFSFSTYTSVFGDKDKHLQVLLSEYMDLKEQLV